LITHRTGGPGDGNTRFFFFHVVHSIFFYRVLGFKYLIVRGIIAPNFDTSEMNYQQRNRALFECIRERCVRTGCNPSAAWVHNVDIIANLVLNV
jgi:hypothetical protein